MAHWPPEHHTTRPPTSLGGILVVFDFVLEVAAVELRGAKDGGETLANKINSLWQRTFNALARYKQEFPWNFISLNFGVLVFECQLRK